MKENPLRKYLRPACLPHFFCPGCGSAQILNFFTRAVDEAKIDFSKVVGIGGVGCAARIPVYLHVDAFHGVHGRTLPWATGVKLHNPALKVVIFAGDGDAAAIGGNHLIQAARRNLDVTMIVVDNLTFAMTGGQAAPTTPYSFKSTTTPYGNSERPFDLCRLVEAAGATYVARGTTARPRQAISALKKALLHRGFSFVELVSQCPTNFGRTALGTGNPVACMNWIEEHSVTIDDAAKAESTGERRFVLGTFVDREEPIFSGTSVSGQSEVKS